MVQHLIELDTEIIQKQRMVVVSFIWNWHVVAQPVVVGSSSKVTASSKNTLEASANMLLFVCCTEPENVSISRKVLANPVDSKKKDTESSRNKLDRSILRLRHLPVFNSWSNWSRGEDICEPVNEKNYIIDQVSNEIME